MTSQIKSEQDKPALGKSDLIKAEVLDHCQVLTINRPESLNSLNKETVEQLLGCLEQVRSNHQIRTVIITGAGRGFCAGQDLSEVVLDSTVASQVESIVLNRCNKIIESICSLPVPVIAAVNGTAAGAGANLALACDFVIAAETASFIQAFVKIGLIPDTGGSFFLPRLVGLANAKRLALLGEKISAEQALAIGLIYKMEQPERVLGSCLQLADELSRLPRQALALTKQALNCSLDSTLQNQLATEATLQRQAASTADFIEGVEAFRSKRTPTFKGK